MTKSKPLSGKDRFGRSRKKMAEFASNLRDSEGIGEALMWYREFVKYTGGSSKNPSVTGDSYDEMTLLGAVGYAAEASEALDEFKKLFFHDKKKLRPVKNPSSERVQKIVTELGDSMWYFFVLVNQLEAWHGIGLREILQNNVNKLTSDPR